MYWGASDNNFQSFVAFWNGAHTALAGIPGSYRTPFGCLIPIHFHHFVTEHYGHGFPHGGYGWMTFIQENSTSDKEALELLLKLRQLYESSRFPTLDEEMIRELEAAGKA